MSENFRAPIFTNEQADLLNNIDRHRDLSRTGVAQIPIKPRETIPAILTAYDGATGAYSWIERSFTSYGTRRTMTIVNGGNTFYEGRRGSPTFQPAFEMNGTILDFTDGKRYDVLLTERFVTPDKGQVYEFSLSSSTARKTPTQYVTEGVGAWFGPYQVTFLDVIAGDGFQGSAYSVVDFAFKLKQYQVITKTAYELVTTFFDFTPGGDSVAGYLTHNYDDFIQQDYLLSFSGQNTSQGVIYNELVNGSSKTVTTTAQENLNKNLLLVVGGLNKPGLTQGEANFWFFIEQLPK